MSENTEICCSPLDIERYQNKEHVWKNKPFVKAYVKQIFHIPLNMGKVITDTFAKITEAKAETQVEDFLMLAYDPSPWKSELYFTVMKNIPDMENVTLSGKYISKVFDGPYNAVPQWIAEFDEYLNKKNLKALKYYFHYAYCPKCAKKYGHNYVVAFAQIEE
jgi:hypothetical protein